jgi:hypothetical protein
MTRLVRVRFLAAPAELLFRAQLHQKELEREFTLISLSDGTVKEEVPARLLEMVERHRREFSTLSFHRDEELAEAMARGDSSIDMEIDMPPAARVAAAETLSTLNEADEFCRRGDLLTLATPPDLIAFREWFLGEIARQFDGFPPTPYS